MATSPYETQAIRNLQRYLRQLSRFDADIPSVDEDGIFGAETRASLEAFQRKYGLPVTGAADAETWGRLFDEYLRSVEERTRPAPVFIFPRHPPDYTVGLGDENIYVAVIQLLLRDILTLYGEESDRPIPDGIFGEDTERAVRDFQRIHRLPEDGRVDRITWNRLARAQAPVVNEYQRQ